MKNLQAIFMVSDNMTNKKRRILNDSPQIECRHLPIFPGRHRPSILGVKELNFRVRNGNGWNLLAIDTGCFKKQN